METSKTEIKSTVKIEISERLFDHDGIVTDIREAKAKLERHDEGDRAATIDEDALTLHLGCGCHKFAVDGSSAITPLNQ